MLVSAVSMNQNSGINFSSRRGSLVEKARKLGLTVLDSDDKRDIMRAIKAATGERDAEALRQQELKRLAKEQSPTRLARLERRAERRAAREAEGTNQVETVRQAEAARPKNWFDKVMENKTVGKVLDVVGKIADAHKDGHGY